MIFLNDSFSASGFRRYSKYFGTPNKLLSNQRGFSGSTYITNISHQRAQRGKKSKNHCPEGHLPQEPLDLHWDLRNFYRQRGIITLVSSNTVRCFSLKCIFIYVYINMYIIPSRELTYPTLGKGKSSSKIDFSGDMLVPRRVYFGGTMI